MENKLQQTSGEPRKLPYQLIKKITNDFSEGRKLGSGAFGTVYKGVHDNGDEVAVKIFRNMAVDDTEFQKEFQNLRRLKHQNIVELKGYCNETEETLMEYQGKKHLVETLRMALCLEYVDNGNLSDHLSDESTGLNWNMRYKIIKGMCEGLKYLRDGLEEPIWHLDLKPDNILLDKNMIAKIADFGLSRLFGEEKTKQTITSGGTCGYWPPEYVKNQVLSSGYDIFSLGVIIVKIMTGREGYSSIADMTRRKFIRQVHDNWKRKLEKNLSLSALQVYCQQVKTCIEIALKCMMQDRHDRPSIQEIIISLNETETVIPDIGIIEKFDDEESIHVSMSSTTPRRPSERKGEAGKCSYTAPRIQFKLLKSMTDGFSYELLLGEGAFARVYKGVQKNGQLMAVKELQDWVPETVFWNTISNHMKAHHQNIVELICYSSEKENKITRQGYKLVSYEKKHMVLCFQYMDNKSLDHHISDEMSGLDWCTRYKIVNGICNGLRYLHEELSDPILHLNLQLDNILLDKDMMPKIGGFSYSTNSDGKGFSGEVYFNNPWRYTPLEFRQKQVISDKFDIYNLGVLVAHIMTGHRYSSRYDGVDSKKLIMSRTEVLRKWRKRLKETFEKPSRESYFQRMKATVKENSLVESYCQQVQKCFDLAVMCLAIERRKRPCIGDIVHVLNDTKTLLQVQHDLQRMVSATNVYRKRALKICDM